MAGFPQTPLPVSMHIAPGADPAAPSTYQFTEITSDVQYAAAIQVQAGRQDEGSKVDTTGHRATLDNRAGNYSRRNPLGSMYGLLRKGTPVQTRVKLIDDQFDRVVANGLGTDVDSGQTWSTSAGYSADGANGLATIASANVATNAILGTVRSDDVDIVKVTSISAVATGAAWVDATVIRYQDSTNFYRVHTEYGLTGIISVKIARVSGGVSTDIFNTLATSVSYSAGAKISTRVQAIGPTIKIKVWLTLGSEPAAWSATVDDTSTTVRGNDVGLYQWRVAGNTNAGSMVLTIYSYRCDTIRATTPVPEWSPRWNSTGSYPTTPIQGAGILRRLSQGQSALRSPMYRQISGYSTLVGYWPFEDDNGATQLADVVPGGQPGKLSNMQLGAAGPAGSAGAATFTNSDPTSVANGTFLSASTTAGWQFSWSAKLAALPASSTQMVSWLTSNNYWWAINLNAGVFVVTVVDPSGSVVVSSSISFTGTDPTQWVTFRMKATASGGTVSWAFAWFSQGAPAVWGSSGTFSGSVGALRSWTTNGNVSMGNGSICHVFGVTTGNDDLQSFAALRSFDGFVGETAGARVLRLALAESIPMIVMGDPAATAAMGVQSAATFLDLVRECEGSDQGLLIERGAGLGFLTNRFRLNVPVTMALDFNAGHIAAPPEPTDDDLNLTNVVILTRKNGSSVTATNPASVALSGAYTDELTVNLGYDAQLDDQAGWRLHLGTIDEMRWPRITLQLHANPSLIYTWCAMRIGSRITVANPPAAVAGGPLDLIVEGYTETITPFAWTVEINCSPARPWDAGIYSDAGTRYTSARNPDGTSATTLASGITSAATSVPITTANTFTVVDPTWSTTSLPYTVEIGGEQMTVTACTARSGSGPWTQTWTVTRAVNGIVKAHAAGEAADLTAIRYYALPV